ncbi:MAG: hypothetical protein HOD60_04000 [Candidatus Nitrosopelagicus sp.]|nr:hypothetical protein [Candidatus Nitrosopelagicus sp.]
MEKTNKPDSKKIIANLTSLDYVVLAAMHHTDLKTMIKMNALELVESCERFFDCGFMKKMEKEPPIQLKLKIQKWLDSVEYIQYTKNTNESLSFDDKNTIRKIYSKLELRPHDLSELTISGIKFLENKEHEMKEKWDKLLKINKLQDVTNLKKSIDECSILIPLMFTEGIANGKLFSSMFKTMNVGMYEYLSKNSLIHPIFLNYLK